MICWPPSTNNIFFKSTKLKNKRLWCENETFFTEYDSIEILFIFFYLFQCFYFPYSHINWDFLKQREKRFLKSFPQILEVLNDKKCSNSKKQFCIVKWEANIRLEEGVLKKALTVLQKRFHMYHYSVC